MILTCCDLSAVNQIRQGQGSNRLTWAEKSCIDRVSHCDFPAASNLTNLISIDPECITRVYVSWSAGSRCLMDHDKERENRKKKRSGRSSSSCCLWKHAEYLAAVSHHALGSQWDNSTTHCCSWWRRIKEPKQLWDDGNDPQEQPTEMKAMVRPTGKKSQERCGTVSV